MYSNAVMEYMNENFVNILYCSRNNGKRKGPREKKNSIYALRRLPLSLSIRISIIIFMFVEGKVMMIIAIVRKEK